ncbi:MAG: phosphatase PAP2 family protein [Fusicatenibacter sp.]
MAIARKPLWARVLEVVGEIPFTTLTIAACAILFRFRTKKNRVLNILCAVGAGVLFALFSVMGGFMTWNYLTDNLGQISMTWMVLIALVMAGVGVWIARAIPAKNRSKALRYAAVALLYFLLVIIIMNSVKAVWGRMRFREMTDPIHEFTRWYQIVPRGGFNNSYASFPSGHSMNSAGVILLILLPPMIPALSGREKVLHTIVYVWCVVVGISRVFMGAHFASDVTVGVLLSLAIFDVLRAIFYRKERKESTIANK